MRELTGAGYPRNTPVAVVYRVGWPEEKVIRGTLADIARKVREAKITLQALILVGPALDETLTSIDPGQAEEVATSHLYSQDYTHLYRTSEKRARRATRAKASPKPKQPEPAAAAANET